MSENIDRINRSLAINYGKNLRGEPIFRIIFSDHQIEKRYGTFREFAGKLFIREFTGLREVPKYAYLKHAWVLERWIPPEACYTPEIPDSVNGSYEPLFAFIDSDYKAIPVIESKVYEILYRLLRPKLAGDQQSDWKEEERKAFNAEVEHNKEVITEEGRTWIGHRLHSGEGIVKP